ncbi:IPT/TIG domain-containing protein [Actinoplanes sp. N902-109]|uniref:IPT/TIG domain-containing protein n=1 Tax=Actinoplanes sp. (strain N902-109) TaxID=649831 RepID=UPI00032951FD|nr:IPT/TIG domain-containing protein [Actinoplanes sp. N902-109]AGL19798.1 hypothetical protein L083_6288 [Actinoplanes sp. N902-109]
MTKSQSHSRPRLVRAGLAAASVTGVLVALTAAPALAAIAPLTLSSTAGPTTGGNTITATSTATANFLSGVTAPVATFSVPACQTTYNTTASTAVTPSSASATAGNVLVTTINKISNTKAAITVPALPLAGASATTTKYNLCIYASNSATAAQIGSGTYTVAAAPVFPGSGVVSPTSGPALGGSTITVTATSGLPTTAGSITATLGGTALTNITPVSSTSFTAVTPAHAPGSVALSVTTAAGTKTIASAFTYANGISVTPNTAPNTSAATYLDVLGAGFLTPTFGSAATNGRVWLVDGEYDPAASGTSYTQGPTAECTGVVVISDNELICSLNLNTGALTPASATANTGTPQVPNGTYTVTVVSNGDAGVSGATGYSQSDISSGSTFTVAPY